MAKIAVVLTDGFADWEYALIGGTGGPFYGLEIQYFSPSPKALCSQGGLNAIVQQDLSDLDAWLPDVIVIIGGLIWDTDRAPDMTELLRAHHTQGIGLAGICGGTLALARAGLLNDIPHTSNDADFLTRNAARYHGSAHYKSSPSATAAGGIITAPGTAPVSFAAAVFKAAGLPAQTVSQFLKMMAAEHG